MEYFKRLFQGRINRRNYLIGSILILLWFFCIEVPYLLIVLDFNQINKLDLHTIMALLGFALLYSIQCLYWFPFDTRRRHDLGYGLWSIAEFFYIFQTGEKKENKYGKPPKPGVDISTLLGLSSAYV